MRRWFAGMVVLLGLAVGCGEIRTLPRTPTPEELGKDRPSPRLRTRGTPGLLSRNGRETTEPEWESQEIEEVVIRASLRGTEVIDPRDRAGYVSGEEFVTFQGVGIHLQVLPAGTRIQTTQYVASGIVEPELGNCAFSLRNEFAIDTAKDLITFVFSDYDASRDCDAFFEQAQRRLVVQLQNVPHERGNIKTLVVELNR